MHTVFACVSCQQSLLLWLVSCDKTSEILNLSCPWCLSLRALRNAPCWLCSRRLGSLSYLVWQYDFLNGFRGFNELLKPQALTVHLQYIFEEKFILLSTATNIHQASILYTHSLSKFKHLSSALFLSRPACAELMFEGENYIYAFFVFHAAEWNHFPT